MNYQNKNQCYKIEYTKPAIFMDFLDPKAKKVRDIRLMVGYFLVAILIITASIILVYRAYGFDVDRKTGQVIQSGLVYIDSAPDDAELYLNGELHNDRTNARLTLPQGNYEILIKKEGYRDWSRTVEVQGGSVERFTYPLLVLQDFTETEVSNFGVERPTVTTQSPDRRWLLVSKPQSIVDFTEFDLGNFQQDDPKKPVQSDITFPSGIFKVADGPESVKVVEWSNDNQNVLVKHTYGTGFEFVILNRDDPAASFNINQILGINPDTITLRDKKPDQWYMYTKKTGLLQSADKDKNIEAVVSDVLTYKSHDNKVVVYAQKTSETQNTIFIKDGDTIYNLRTVNTGAVKLDIARYENAWYVVVGSDGDKRTYVYKNPVQALSKDDALKPPPVAVLKATEPINNVLFSTNTQFIMARNGQNIGVYDAEDSESYNYTLAGTVDKGTVVTWMDGHRIQYRSGGFETIVDFDGSNAQKLITTIDGQSAFFDRDYTVLYTLNTIKSQKTAFGLFSTDLRLEADK